MFRKLDLIWNRLRVLVEQPKSSRNASEEEMEKYTLEMELENLRASLGQLDKKAGVRYRFKSKKEIRALVEKNPDHPYVCSAAGCKRVSKGRDRLHEHIRSESKLKECSSEHSFLFGLVYNPFCFRCHKNFSQRCFLVRVRNVAWGEKSTIFGRLSRSPILHDSRLRS